MNFGPQTGQNRTGVFTHPISFSASPSHTLSHAVLSWRPTATLNETALVCLQLRFEAPKYAKLEILSRRTARAALCGNRPTSLWLPSSLFFCTVVYLLQQIETK